MPADFFACREFCGKMYEKKKIRYGRIVFTRRKLYAGNGKTVSHTLC